MKLVKIKEYAEKKQLDAETVRRYVRAGKLVNHGTPTAILVDLDAKVGKANQPIPEVKPVKVSPEVQAARDAIDLADIEVKRIEAEAKKIEAETLLAEAQGKRDKPEILEAKEKDLTEREIRISSSERDIEVRLAAIKAVKEDVDSQRSALFQERSAIVTERLELSHNAIMLATKHDAWWHERTNERIDNIIGSLTEAREAIVGAYEIIKIIEDGGHYQLHEKEWKLKHAITWYDTNLERIENSRPKTREEVDAWWREQGIEPISFEDAKAVEIKIPEPFEITPLRPLPIPEKI